MKTVAQTLVEWLKSMGVDTVFGIPGVHTIELYRALPGSGIRHVTPRHEAGAGFMADFPEAPDLGEAPEGQPHHAEGRQAAEDHGIDRPEQAGGEAGLRHAELVGATNEDRCHRRNTSHHLRGHARLQDGLTDDYVHCVGRSS